MAQVFIPAQLQSLTAGVRQVNVQAGDVAEVVRLLDDRFPGIRERLCEGDRLSPSLQVSVDHQLSNQGLRAKVPPGAEVHFVPALGGG